VFVNGTLIGGFDDTVAMHQDGSFQEMLGSSSSTETKPTTSEDKGNVTKLEE
jgi:hypothetical protein